MLEADAVTVRFGGVRACDGVSLAVARGEVLGLVGPNGSGKSTFLNALTGVVAAGGALRLDGRRLPLGRPGRIRRAGVGRTFQTPQVFGELSCIENVLLADGDRRLTGLAGAWLARPAMWRHERRRWDRAIEQLAVVGLDHLAEAPAGLLAYGQRRLLEIARTLNGGPSILLLDEPSAGLDAAETDGLARLLSGVRQRGVGLLVVDHKIDFIEALCDRVAVLQLGRVIAEGPPAAVWEEQAVIDAYLGTR